MFISDSFYVNLRARSPIDFATEHSMMGVNSGFDLCYVRNYMSPGLPNQINLTAKWESTIMATPSSYY